MLPDRDPSIESKFPDLAREGYQITSPQDRSYNCIAWVVEDQQRFWWPHRGAYWPDSVPRMETIDAFIQAYGLYGYVVCESADYEEGWEKIVIYTNDDGIPKHASRQLNSTEWTSKLGSHHDISHSLNGLSGLEYGTPRVFLKRQTKNTLSRIIKGLGL